MHVRHVIFKGIFLVLGPYLLVTDLSVTKTNLVDNSFLVLLEGFLEGQCCLLTRDIHGGILIGLLHKVVPHVLVGVLECLW